MEQLSFDPDSYGGRAKAMKERDSVAKSMKLNGHRVRRWVLRNQQRGYSGYGTSRDYSIRDVFMLDVYK